MRPTVHSITSSARGEMGLLDAPPPYMLTVRAATFPSASEVSAPPCGRLRPASTDTKLSSGTAPKFQLEINIGAPGLSVPAHLLIAALVRAYREPLPRIS